MVLNKSIISAVLLMVIVAGSVRAEDTKEVVIASEQRKKIVAKLEDDKHPEAIHFKESRSTSGKGANYRIRCSDKHYAKVKKLDKRMYEDCKDFVFTISEVPNGSSLKRSHNTLLN